ncbi:MAG: peroxiredoxin [Ilumatobacteraceae bacterium]|nr:peroxiredoxin [Ilumatobacteraceae bacterium]
MAVTAGDPAPSFSVPGTLGGERRTYTLEEFAGRPVVLVFYPGDNTPICTEQLNSYTDDIDQFLALGAQLLAISPEDLDSHEGFADHQGGFAFPLLADTDKSLARSYGVLGPVGFYRRCVFVIDGGGRLTYVHRGYAGSTFRTTGELVEAIHAARSAALG